jgi:predicted XRE-type DNA-binding protein
MYVAKFEEAIYVLHCFQKKTQETNKQNKSIAEAAEVMMVSRPCVSNVVNKKTAKFTIDTLVEMLSRVGKPVKLAVG